MASIKLTIHIPPDSNPNNIYALIADLSNNHDLLFESSSELNNYLLDQGIGSRTEIQSTATEMGILKKTPEGIQLSQDGLAVSKVRGDSCNDLLHFLLYTGWTAQRPADFLQSWAYKQVCDQYWAMGTIKLDSTYLDRQVGDIINLAQIAFPPLGVDDFDQVSFSRKSLLGASKWLEAVTPTVIEGKAFNRRTFCSPELVVMAIGYVLRDEDNVNNIDILLTPEKREAICKLCLLDPDGLDRALDWALPIFSHIVSPGTTAGFYGRFIRLNKRPELKDVVR